MTGTILRGVGGLYCVAPKAASGAACAAAPKAASGAAAPAGAGEYVLCVARGIFRKYGIKPLPGDDVVFEMDRHQRGHGAIVAINKRETVLARPAVANATQLLAVVSRAEPKPDFMFVDKLAVRALAAGVQPAVFASKPDLEADAGFEAELEGYARAGFKVVVAVASAEGAPAAGGASPAGTSPMGASPAGASPMGASPACAPPGLMELLKGHVTVFAGQSGVGKSTLMNAVLGRDRMPVGEISRRIRRGRNTTRHAELLPLECGGYAVDTPGFSALDADGAAADDEWMPAGELRRYYPELARYEGLCRFAGCSHVHEPGCAAIAAMLAGELHAGRHARYAELCRRLWGGQGRGGRPRARQ